MDSYQCDQCLKWFSSPYNMRRHQATSCTYSNTNSGNDSSNTEDEVADMYTNEETKGQSVKSYTDEETEEDSEGEHTAEQSSEIYEESEEEDNPPSEGEHTAEQSSEIYEESEDEDNPPWEFILNEVHQRMDPMRDALVEKTTQDASVEKIMQENDITHDEAMERLYDALQPEYTKQLMKIYKQYLRLFIGLQRDSTHQKIKKTMKRLIDEEGYDEDESIDAAVNQRKFLLQRMLTYATIMENTNLDINPE